MMSSLLSSLILLFATAQLQSKVKGAAVLNRGQGETPGSGGKRKALLSGGRGSALPDDETQPVAAPFVQIPAYREPELSSKTLPVALTGSETLHDLIVGRQDLSEFKTLLDRAGLLDGLLGDDSLTQKLTVFAPTNVATLANEHVILYKNYIDELPRPRWSEHLLAVCRNHMVQLEDGTALQWEEIYDNGRTSLQSMHDEWEVSQVFGKVGGAGPVVKDIPATNGMLHIVDAVIPPKFFEASFAELEVQSEFGPDLLDRISMVDVVDFVGGRQTLSQTRQTGMTYAGCQIQAFDRMGVDYLTQTLNGGRFVKENELMNETFKSQTLENFVEYQLIPTNYYYDDHVELDFEELVLPVGECSHIWVTSRLGKLCFNDGCVVKTPDARTFLASNGVGYVLDTCIICSGIVMLTDYAGRFSSFKMSEVAELFLETEWNLRDLSSNEGVGDGSKLTLFASINQGFDYFTWEDRFRLLIDKKWQRHLWDLCRHFLVQGEYTYADLKNYTLAHGGPWHLTTLAGENITIDYNSSSNRVLVDDGEILMPDIKGQDGFVHFTTDVPKPRSVTKTAYTVLEDLPDQIYSIQLGFLTSVFLDEDIKRLSPLTCFYAPNQYWDGKLVPLLQLKELLENMIFTELLFCEKLLEIAEVGGSIESYNGRLWTLVLNDDGSPCIETPLLLDSPQIAHVCITQCDILARNGIVHVLDNVLESPPLTTLAPFPPVAPFPSVAPQPVVHQVQNDTNEPTVAAPALEMEPFPSVAPQSIFQDVQGNTSEPTVAAPASDMEPFPSVAPQPVFRQVLNNTSEPSIAVPTSEVATSGYIVLVVLVVVVAASIVCSSCYQRGYAILFQPHRMEACGNVDSIIIAAL